MASTNPHCLACDRYFSSQTALDSHRYNSKKHNPENTCHSCYRSFQTRNGLEGHRGYNMVDCDLRPERGKVYCGVCDILFRHSASLVEHMRSENHQLMVERLGPRARIQCIETTAMAAAEAASGINASEEVPTPGTIERGEYLYRDRDCIPCARKFPSKEAFTEHVIMNELHNPQRICAQCFRKFRDVQNLWKHFRGCFHPPIHTRIQCDPCQSIFNTKGDLDKHLDEDDHRDVMELWCDVCQLLFVSSHALNQHYISEFHKKWVGYCTDHKKGPNADLKIPTEHQQHGNCEVCRTMVEKLKDHRREHGNCEACRTMFEKLEQHLRKHNKPNAVVCKSEENHLGIVQQDGSQEKLSSAKADFEFPFNGPSMNFSLGAAEQDALRKELSSSARAAVENAFKGTMFEFSANSPLASGSRNPLPLTQTQTKSHEQPPTPKATYSPLFVKKPVTVPSIAPQLAPPPLPAPPTVSTNNEQPKAMPDYNKMVEAQLAIRRHVSEVSESTRIPPPTNRGKIVNKERINLLPPPVVTQRMVGDTLIISKGRLSLPDIYPPPEEQSKIQNSTSTQEMAENTKPQLAVAGHGKKLSPEAPEFIMGVKAPPNTPATSNAKPVFATNASTICNAGDNKPQRMPSVPLFTPAAARARTERVERIRAERAKRPISVVGFGEEMSGAVQTMSRTATPEHTAVNKPIVSKAVPQEIQVPSKIVGSKPKPTRTDKQNSNSEVPESPITPKFGLCIGAVERYPSPPINSKLLAKSSTPQATAVSTSIPTIPSVAPEIPSNRFGGFDNNPVQLFESAFSGLPRALDKFNDKDFGRDEFIPRCNATRVYDKFKVPRDGSTKNRDKSDIPTSSGPEHNSASSTMFAQTGPTKQQMESVEDPQKDGPELSMKSGNQCEVTVPKVEPHVEIVLDKEEMIFPPLSYSSPVPGLVRVQRVYQNRLAATKRVDSKQLSVFHALQEISLDVSKEIVAGEKTGQGELTNTSGPVNKETNTEEKEATYAKEISDTKEVNSTNTKDSSDRVPSPTNEYGLSPESLAALREFETQQAKELKAFNAKLEADQAAAEAMLTKLCSLPRRIDLSRIPKPCTELLLQVPDFDWMCTSCRLIFPTEVSLRSHYEDQDHDWSVWCAKCDTIFDNKGKLQKHKCETYVDERVWGFSKGFRA
ncbi:hypothetical protein BDD12DRAFT_802745 [Trichophaea hybrida]|nr:hypothetical protein BDD12DRAFT_802745 [Trichophaea hybrida]